MTDEEVFGTPAKPSPDPYSAGNTAGRIGIGALTGIPDAIIGVGNAAVRLQNRLPSWMQGVGQAGVEPGQMKEAPYVGPMAQKAAGVQALPPDAPLTRQLLEGMGSAALGGGVAAPIRAVAAAPSVARAVLPAVTALGRSVVAPTVASHTGGAIGGWAGEQLGDRETGALLGSLAGGVLPGAAVEAPTRYTDWKFRGMGREGAPEIAAQAERQGVMPNAAMLGNDQIQMRERTLANRGGFAGDYVTGRRNDARDQIANAWDRMTEARGSTDPRPTPGTIGYEAAEVARQGADDLQARASRMQDQLMTRIGPRTSVDAAGALAQMENVRGRTDPLTAAPIDARLQALRQMLPTDEHGRIISTDVPYERYKDLRTNLRERSQGYDPVPGRYAREINQAMTGDMRDAAVSQGVPGGYFDTVQHRYADIKGEGGPHEQLTDVAGREPSAAYSYLKGGEQNPQRLRLLQNTGNPAMDRVFGDYLRMMGNDTISSGKAPGPRNLATRVEKMDPDALDTIGGAQRPDITDIAGLARAIDIPPQSNGLGRVVGGISRGVPGVLTAGELGAEAGRVTGIPGATMAGRVAGYALGPAMRYIQARQMQSPTALNAMAGGRSPPSANTMSDLVAAITAAQQQNRRP